MDKRLSAYYTSEVKKYNYPSSFFLRRRNIADEALIQRDSISEDFTQFDVIQKAILVFERDLGEGWVLRDDAKLLIFLNFDKLVYRPLRRVMQVLELNQKLYNDVSSVLQSSKNLKSESDDKEISSHDILKAGLEKWNSLQTVSSKTWF